MSEELTVTDETDGFVKVSIEEGDGWVSKDYVDLRTDYVYAESKACLLYTSNSSSSILEEIE